MGSIVLALSLSRAGSQYQSEEREIFGKQQ